VKLTTTILSLILIGGVLLAFVPVDDEADRAYRRSYSLILEERWSDAEQAFTEFLTEHDTSRWNDDAAFWICFSKHKGRLSPEESFNCYRDFIENHPHSEWRDDASRTLVMLGKQLAEKGRPELLAEARAVMELHDRDPDEPDDELMVMLESVAERDPQRATEVVFAYFDKAEDPRLRAKIVLLMDDIETQRVTEKLAEIVRGDVSARVRVRAVEVLADRLDNEIARNTLLEVVRSEKHPDALRAGVLSIIGHEDFPGKKALLSELAVKARGELYYAVLETLVDDESSDSVAMLMKLYEDTDDRERREHILHAMAETESAEALTRLIEIARGEEDDRLAGQAVQSLESYPGSVAIPALEQLIVEDVGWRVKVAAAYTMGSFETAEAVTALDRILANQDHPEIRIAAINGLGQTEHVAAIPILVKMIREGRTRETRRHAVEALDELSELPEAREAMLILLQERLEEGDQ